MKSWRNGKGVKQMDAGLTIGGTAYWVSLRGAAASTNTVEQTVYIPKSQEITQESLAYLVQQVAVRTEPNDRFFLYHPPAA